MKRTFIAALVALSTSPAGAEPMSFELVSNGGNCETCAWTVARGEITPATPQAFRTYLAEQAYHGRVMFDSPGGNLGAALELGRIIRANGITTGIARSEPDPTAGAASWYRTAPGGTCESACAFSFFGGATRTAYEDDTVFAPSYGQLGMHQFFALGDREIPSADTQRLMGEVLQYMLEMGVDAGLLSRAARTPPDEMYFFSRDELLELGVLSRQGSEPMGLFSDKGGLVLGWRATHGSGEIDREITLRCSAAAGSWVLRVEDRGSADTAGAFDFTDLDGIRGTINDQVFEIAHGDILAVGVAGDAGIFELRLPRDLAFHPGEELKIRFENRLRVESLKLGAWETLPDAEDFSVLARACGA